MQCGLVFFLLLFSEYLGISRRSLLFGISLGFGLFAAMNMLVATGMSAIHGILRQDTLRHINSAAYLVSCDHLVWLYLGGSHPRRARLRKDHRCRLRTGIQPCRKLACQSAADSLLDTMDRTVERSALSPEEVEDQSFSRERIRDIAIPARNHTAACRRFSFARSLPSANCNQSDRRLRLARRIEEGQWAHRRCHLVTNRFHRHLHLQLGSRLAHVAARTLASAINCFSSGDHVVEVALPTCSRPLYTGT